jgi:hypothetical protein
MFRFSASEARLQTEISSIVRKQPSHSPFVAFRVHTLMHGEAVEGKC